MSTELLACREALKSARDETARATAKWVAYERDYILPTFTWAEECGIDLRQLVQDNAGRNCVALLVDTLRGKLSTAEELIRKCHAIADAAVARGTTEYALSEIMVLTGLYPKAPQADEVMTHGAGGDG